MDIYAMIKTYGEGKGKDVMWKTVRHISEFVENSKNEHPNEYRALKKMVYADMMGGHYNEEFAVEQMNKMYYKDVNGQKHYAPYWTEEKMRQAYKSNMSLIPSEYNEFDFMVTMCMMMSDNKLMIDQWFPNATEDQKMSYIVDMTVNYLDDEDAPHPKSKIWSYFN